MTEFSHSMVDGEKAEIPHCSESLEDTQTLVEKKAVVTFVVDLQRVITPRCLGESCLCCRWNLSLMRQCRKHSRKLSDERAVSQETRPQ